jgi:hypothetical protein
MAGVYRSLLQAVSDTIATLQLSYRGVLVPVAIRDLPRVEEGLDTLPVFLITPHTKPFRWTRFGSEGQKKWTYPVEVTAVSASNFDFVDSEGSNLDWREAVANAFNSPTVAAVPSVRLVEIDGDPPLDRGKLNQQYRYSTLSILFHSIEGGTP